MLLNELTAIDWWKWLTVALDVLLVYFLVYRLLMLVRGTRAERMLLGLGVVVLVYIFSWKLELATLNWILGNFLGSVILVVVVLFQDDLRRALTNVGLIPGLGSELPSSYEVTLQEICRAAGELSSRRIGGLIVLRREVGLEEYTEHAIEIDAKVSHQLLVSIFLPTSPIHDGAVVIDHDRIVVAGAVLPLSFNPSISSSYGTRHRAAMGLAERTDALLVVVSEETGVISLIREGRITKELDEKSLFSALYRLTIYRYQRREKIKKQQKLGEAKPEAVASKDSGDSENGVEGLENDGAKEAV